MLLPPTIDPSTRWIGASFHNFSGFENHPLAVPLPSSVQYKRCISVANKIAKYTADVGANWSTSRDQIITSMRHELVHPVKRQPRAKLLYHEIDAHDPNKFMHDLLLAFYWTFSSKDDFGQWIDLALDRCVIFLSLFYDDEDIRFRPIIAFTNFLEELSKPTVCKP